MLKKRIFIVLLVGVALFPMTVMAVSNPYSEYFTNANGDYIQNCGWVAWKYAYEKTGVAMPRFNRNAKYWLEEAKKVGYQTGKEPKPNSIIVWDNGTYEGHVGFVEETHGNNVQVWESGCHREMTQEEQDKYWNCIINETVSEEDSYKCDYLRVIELSSCSFDAYDKTVLGYIYITEPRTNNSIQSNGVNESNNSNKENTVKVKSSNNYLSELSIENLDLNFDKNTYDYSFEVENEIDEIFINAKAEDEKSKIDGVGTFSLNVGDNNFLVKVTAEDKSIKEYKISIMRKEKIIEKVEDDILTNDEKINTKKNNYILFIGLGILFIIISLVIIVVVYRRKHKKIND